ncbi:hypothetical protein C8A01DRAFT_21218, partial [Parachaetomium inaequale]
MQSDGDAEVDRRVWASVPWSAVSDPGTGTGADTPIGWHKSGIPYPTPGAEAVPLPLQTLDVWIPASTPNNTATPPDPSSLPHPLPGSTWIVYIHGGAWRDPRISAASFTAAATALLLQNTTTPKHNLAGLISLNYRLSPHPSHPSPSDPSRQAKHPDHIADVHAALAFLHRLPILNTDNWILTGHSCGATLAFQAVMDPARWGGLPPSSVSFSPSALVGFNGLYDLAGFIASPPEGYA